MPATGRRDHRRTRTRAALAEAALRLFAERGYDAVTVDEVAAEADVAPRTAFRHVADKADLVFDDGAAVDERLRAELAARPRDEDAGAAARAALLALVDLWQGRHAEGRVRQRVIDGSPALRARALVKLAEHQAVLADGLVQRAVAADRARLVARLAVACFDEAVRRWLEDEPPGDLGAVVRHVLDQVDVRG